MIILSGNILSWTVCVESSCFLTPVGGSVHLPVLLCFCSPSVSVVVSWHLYSSEGWGRPEKRGEAFPGWPLWWHSNSAAVLSVSKAVSARDTIWKKLRSGPEPLIITAYVHACHVKALWMCRRSRKQLWSENKISVSFTFFSSLLDV